VGPYALYFVITGETDAAVSVCPGSSSTDGQNTVGWGELPGSTLARTCVWFSGFGSPSNAVEFDMQIDPDWDWTTGQPVATDADVLHLDDDAQPAVVLAKDRRPPPPRRIAALEVAPAGLQPERGAVGHRQTPVAIPEHREHDVERPLGERQSVLHGLGLVARRRAGAEHEQRGQA